MTALVLGAEKIISFRLSDYGSGFRLWFLTVNRRGFLSACLAAGVGLSAVAYLAALVMFFHWGLEAQSYSAKIAGIQQDILKSEIFLASRDASFTRDHQDILRAMERISAITYLPRPSEAAMAPAGDFRH